MSVTDGVPFIQAAHVSTGSNLPVNRIVIHGTVSPCVPGGAMQVARYFTSSTSGGSAQYVVDPGQIVQCVAEAAIAWHAPPNRGSIGIELCDPQAGPSSRWSDAGHESMLRLAAAATAELAAKYGLPLVRLNAADLLAGKRGICGHVDVSQAWHQSDHTDPGSDFPWDRFMGYVTGSTTAPPPPPPAPASHEPPTQGDHGGVWLATMHLGADNSDSVRNLQRALRDYPGISTIPLNPSGVSGHYGSETADMCSLVYRTFNEWQPGHGWADGDLSTPGRTLLAKLGLRVLG